MSCCSLNVVTASQEPSVHIVCAVWFSLLSLYIVLYSTVKFFHAGCFHGFTALQVCLWCSRCCWLPCCAAREGGCHGQYTRERTSHTWHRDCGPLENPFKRSHRPTHAHSEHRDVHISHINTQTHTRGEDTCGHKEAASFHMHTHAAKAGLLNNWKKCNREPLF